MRIPTYFSRPSTWTLLLGAALFLLAACGGSEAPAPAPTTAANEAAAPSPTPMAATPTQAPTEIAATQAAPAETETPATPAAQPIPQDWRQHAYREGDLFFLGNPAAPIRMIDYSDFL